MAIALDAATDGSHATGSGPFTFAHTCTGANRILFVLVYGGDGSDVVTGVTYAGVAMTFVQKIKGASVTHYLYCYALVAPMTGSNTVSVAYTGSHYMSAGAISYTGAKQTAQPEVSITKDGAAGTSLTTTQFTQTNNAWTLLCAAAGNKTSTQTAGTGSTARTNTAASWDFFDSGAAIAAAGSTSMAFSTTAGGVASILLAITPPDDYVLAVTVNGTTRTASVDRHSIDITRGRNEAPDKCNFTAFGFVPAKNQVVIIRCSGRREFEGTITRVKQKRRTLTARAEYRCECIDYTRGLQGILVTKKYGSQSATATFQDLAGLASGYTTINIPAGLPTVAAIEFKLTPLPQAFTQLAEAMVGNWDVDSFKDIHAYTTDTAGAAARTLSASNPDFRDFSYDDSIEDLFNRICVEGEGGRCAADRAIGDTTLPLGEGEGALFASGGGSATARNQILTYTGRELGGDGMTVVGPLQAPGTPSASKTTGGGRIQGTVSYKVSFVLGDRGESELSSASGTVAGTAVSAPGTFAGITPSGTGGSMAYGFYSYKVTYVAGSVQFNGVTIAGETTLGTSSGGTNISGGSPGNGSIAFTGMPTSGDSRVVARRIYRSRVNQDSSGPWYFVTQINDNSTTAWTDTMNDTGLGAEGPSTNTTGDTGALSSIPTGTGATARKLYRTEGGGSTYRYLATIGDNSTTTYTDTKADSELGDVAPTTSHVKTLAGATALRVSDGSKLLAGGGWLKVGSQTVRYTGRSASSGEANATGVPASGTGSLLSDVSYDTTVTTLPFLSGIPSSSTGSILHALTAGDDVSIYFERNDTSSQSTYGIRAMPVRDRLLTLTSAPVRGDAELALRKDPRTTGGYTTTDAAAVPGRALTISLSSEWGVSGTFQILSGRVFWEETRPEPQRTVTFSNVTADKDLFRIIRVLQAQAAAAAA